MTHTTTITTPAGRTVRLSATAAETLAWVGHGPAAIDEDVDRLALGIVTAADLLAHCLDGAEGSDVTEAWTEYVAEVDAIATETVAP